MLDYQDAVESVWSFGDYFEKRSDHTYASAGIELGRVRRLLERLDSPQQAFSVVTVAGTNGKGSTSAMVASILKAAGVVAGLYSQPHLHSFRERIQVGGVPIDPDSFVALTRKVVEAARSVNAEQPKEYGLSAYEVGTALALRYFADVGAEAGKRTRGSRGIRAVSEGRGRRALDSRGFTRQPTLWGPMRLRQFSGRRKRGSPPVADRQRVSAVPPRNNRVHAGD